MFHKYQRSTILKKSSENISLKAAGLVMKCGVQPSLIGYTFLAEASVLYAFEKTSVSNIYRKIAEKYGIQPRSVMRNMSYALSQGFDVHKKLSRIMGVEIPNNQIHNSLVIAYIAFKLKTDDNKDRD